MTTEQELDDLRLRMANMERKMDRILSMVRGIAIGAVVAGVIFGYIQIRDLLSIAK